MTSFPQTAFRNITGLLLHVRQLISMTFLGYGFRFVAESATLGTRNRLKSITQAFRIIIIRFF